MDQLAIPELVRSMQSFSESVARLREAKNVQKALLSKLSENPATPLKQVNANVNEKKPSNFLEELNELIEKNHEIVSEIENNNIHLKFLVGDA